MNQSNLESSIKRLQDTGHLKAIKAEFESEGTMVEELSILSDLCSRNGIALTLKIGGALARKDIQVSFFIGADSILAPMIESAYAASRFLEIVSEEEKYFVSKIEKMSYLINIETNSAIRNLKTILEVSTSSIPAIKYIVIGRSDLSLSLGIKEVESQKLLSICKNAISLSKDYPIEVILGGSIGSKSYPFINDLSKNGLIAFESRKCTFRINQSLDSNKFNELIHKAIEFEIEWLNVRRSLYLERSNLDLNRKKLLESRLENNH